MSGDIVGDGKIKWIVKWNKNRMGFSLYPTTEQIYDEMPINVENKLGFKILGNIYDNTELLGLIIENMFGIIKNVCMPEMVVYEYITNIQ